MEQRIVGLKDWLRNLLLFFGLSSLLLSLMCALRSDLATAIGILSALYLGWFVVARAYLLVKGRMSLLGDIVLLASTVVVIVVAPLVASLWCSLANISLFQCGEYTVTACRFVVAFPMSIACFSLWLWMRIRQLRGKQFEPIE